MAAETRKHNDSVYLKQVQTLKENGVPGSSTVPKVEYLMDKYPHIKTKDVAEIIGVSVQSVHTARWKIRKGREAAQNVQNTDVNIEQKKVRPEKATPQEIEKTHVDIWDQPYEPPYVPQEPIYAPQAAPAYIQPVIPPQTLAASRDVVFELGLSGADGLTLRSLISVLYGKIADNRQYRVHIKIEEE